VCEELLPVDDALQIQSSNRYCKQFYFFVIYSCFSV